MTGYVECPTEYDGQGPALFLAGGITGCPNWQSDVRRLLDGANWTLLNPRRSTDFDWAEEDASRQQIDWEFRHLRKADAILFWFPAETICPIALYELGAWSMTTKPLYVGTHPDYPRRRDVEIQTALARPEIQIHDDLHKLVRATYDWNFSSPSRFGRDGEERAEVGSGDLP